MAQIKFETGQIVDFQGTPTAQDVEEVAKKLGISKQPQSQLEMFQQTQANRDDGVKGVAGIGVGVGKSLASTAVGTGKLLQGLGQRGLAAALPGISLEDVRGSTGIKSLDSNTEQGQKLQGMLERKGTAEKFGGVVGDIGTFFVPGGAITKAGSVTAKASKLGRTGQALTKASVEGLGYGTIQSAQQGKIDSSSLGAFAGGAAFSGAGSAVGAFKSARQAKNAGFATKLGMPKETNAVKVLAREQGRVTSPTAFGKSEILPNARDTQIGKALANVVSPKKNVEQNVGAIKDSIKSIDSSVTNYVTKNKVPFNTNQLKTQLVKGKDDLELVFASDKTAEKTYNALVDVFMKQIKGKDTAGLLRARKDFDKLPAVKKLLETDKLGENARKEISLAVRRSANKYISSLLPNGSKYEKAMLQEHLLFEGLGNIAAKNTKAIGKNKLQIITDEYPIMKWLVGGAATGLVGGAGIGVGSSIIGSTN